MKYLKTLAKSFALGENIALGWLILFGGMAAWAYFIGYYIGIILGYLGV